MMDFLERFLNISPDAGDGSFERAIVFAIVFAGLVAILVTTMTRRRRRKPRRLAL